MNNFYELLSRHNIKKEDFDVPDVKEHITETQSEEYTAMNLKNDKHPPVMPTFPEKPDNAADEEDSAASVIPIVPVIPKFSSDQTTPPWGDEQSVAADTFDEPFDENPFNTEN